jgi:hypothetical protein
MMSDSRREHTWGGFPERGAMEFPAAGGWGLEMGWVEGCRYQKVTNT